MLAEIVIENGQKKIKPLTADIGAGVPIGFFAPFAKKSSPSGWLYCDGSTFDENVYPALYQYLGTNKLPDLREIGLKGAEKNTTYIFDSTETDPSTGQAGTQNHDVFAGGEFKDDQLQNHRHQLPALRSQGSSGYWYTFETRGSSSDSDSTGNIDDRYTARIGNVTRGKSYGIYWYVKATSGLPENQQDNVLATINANNSYSTEEHATGKKTTDGKDIYSRTFIYNNVALSTTGTTLQSNFPIDYDKVTKYEGYAYRSNTPLSIPVQPYISGTSLNCIQSISSSTFEKVEITIEYTKD